MGNIDQFLRQSIDEYNRRFAAAQPTPPLQPKGIQAAGFAEGGMQMRPAKGIIPGPVNLRTGDDVMTPMKRGEYVWPVEAVMARGASLFPGSQLSPEDQLAAGKMALDQEVTGLKRSMGDMEPVRNAGVPQTGYAEGGMTLEEPVNAASIGIPQQRDPMPERLAPESKGIPFVGIADEPSAGAPKGLTPDKVLFSAAPGPDATGVFQPATTVTTGNLDAGLANKLGKGVLANGTDDNNLGDTASIVKGIQQDGSTTDVAKGISGKSPMLELRGDIDTGNAPVRADTDYRRQVIAGAKGIPFDQLSSTEKAAFRAEGELDHRQFVDKPVFGVGGKVIGTQAVESTPQNTINGKHVDELLGPNPDAARMKAVGDMFAERDRTEVNKGLVQADIALKNAKAKGIMEGGNLKPSGVAEDGRRVFYNRNGEQFAQGTDGQMEPYSGKVTNINGMGGHGGSGEPLTPENVKRYAEIYNRTGELPPLGRNTADRQSILNAAGDLARAEGATPEDIAVRHENFKSDKKSLAAVTKGMDTINSFEKGVQNSLTLVGKLSDGFNRGQYPGINKLSQLVSGHAGNPEIKAFKNALTTAMTEYMKVTTAGTGISSSELSIGAQQRAKELLETSDNPETFKESIELMRQEMEIKKRAFQEQHGEIQIRMQGGSPAAMNTAERFVQDQAVGGVEKARGLQPHVAPGSSGKSVDTSRPVTKGGVVAYRQADGSVMDANGRRLN